MITLLLFMEQLVEKDCPIGVKCVTFDIVNPVSVNTERWKNAEEHTLWIQENVFTAGLHTLNPFTKLLYLNVNQLILTKQKKFICDEKLMEGKVFFWPGVAQLEEHLTVEYVCHCAEIRGLTVRIRSLGLCYNFILDKPI